MNTFQELTLKYIVGCVGSRILFSCLLQYAPEMILPALYFLCAAISLGFGGLWLFGLRTEKGAFNNRIWWNSLRVVHAFFFILSSWFLYKKKQYLAATVILLDTSFGIGAYFIHHYNEGNLNKLIEHVNIHKFIQ